jgi:hypothetical protein
MMYPFFRDNSIGKGPQVQDASHPGYIKKAKK